MISVIVPVYNSEKFLHVCLNSVLKQTYEDFEIICIDDKSTDSSLEILNFFSKKDYRIKIIKNNYRKGIGYCLNKGLNIARGEYVLFLDSKDWLSINSLELLVKKIKEDLSEIIVFKNVFYDNSTNNFSISDENTNIIKIDENKPFNYSHLEKNTLFEMLGSYNSFYLKSFLNKLDLTFPIEDESYIYDLLFYKTIINAEKISLINKNLYNLRENTSPELELTNKKLFKEIYRKYEIFKIFLENRKLYEYYKTNLFDFSINNILNKIIGDYPTDFLNGIQPIFQELILKYGLYEGIIENVDESILEKINFKILASNLNNTYPQVSVVLPVYNVEDYLPKCLDSICNQSFKDIEIICIDDGSTDKSHEILKDYEEHDLRITIITQENGGLGFARNVGMKNAKGKYILFIDSDDYIELNAIEQAYNNLISNNSDLAIFKFSRFNEENITYSQTGFPLDNIFGDINYNMFSFSYKDIKQFVLNSSFSTWSKIYKKEFLNTFDSDFPVGIAYEDVLFHVKSLLNAKSISFIPKFLYNYRNSNPNSIMSNKSYIFDIIKVCKNVEEYLKRNNYFNEFKFEFLMFKITQLSQYLQIADSEEYFVHVKKEFEQLAADKEYDENDFKNLKDKQNQQFYTVLNSNNYKDYLKNIAPNIS